MNELLNELHDSGVIKIEGRENPTFDPSVLEIEENKENNNPFNACEQEGLWHI